MAKKQYAVYFDYTGAGRGPEPIAGPFSTEEEAQKWSDEYYPEDRDVFVDIYRD